LLRIGHGCIAVEHLVWQANSATFALGEAQRFDQTPDGWTLSGLDHQ